MKYGVLLFFFIFTSCTHSIRVSSKGCKSVGLVSETSADYKSFKKNILFFGFSKEIRLDDILKKEKVRCNNVKFINYTWKQGPLDSLLSLLPFVTQKTLKVNYAYK